MCSQAVCFIYSAPTDIRLPPSPPLCSSNTDKLLSKCTKQDRKSKVRLLPKYPCRTRSGMSVAVDTAWKKKGFNSLTCKFYGM